MILTFVMTHSSRCCRAGLAASLALIIVLLSPGLDFYQAMAQMETKNETSPAAIGNPETIAKDPIAPLSTVEFSLRQLRPVSDRADLPEHMFARPADTLHGRSLAAVRNTAAVPAKPPAPGPSLSVVTINGNLPDSGTQDHRGAGIARQPTAYGGLLRPLPKFDALDPANNKSKAETDFLSRTGIYSASESGPRPDTFARPQTAAMKHPPGLQPAAGRSDALKTGKDILSVLTSYRTHPSEAKSTWLPKIAKLLRPAWIRQSEMLPFSFSAAAIVFTFLVALKHGALTGVLGFGTGWALPFVIGAVCYSFSSLSASEALGQAIPDEASRVEASKEMERILRNFGEKVEEKARSADIKTQVDPELVTRSAIKGIVQTLENFLGHLQLTAASADGAETIQFSHGDFSIKMPKEVLTDLAAAKHFFEEMALEYVVRALREIGLSQDSEAAIRSIVSNSGVGAEVMAWESKHRFVELLLEKVRRERESRTQEKKSESLHQKILRTAGDGGDKLALIFLIIGFTATMIGSLHMAASIGVPLIVKIMHGGFASCAGIFSGLLGLQVLGSVLSPGLGSSPDIPKKDDKSLDHIFQTSQLAPQEIEFVRDVTIERIAAPSRPMVTRIPEAQKIADVLSRPAGMSRGITIIGPKGSDSISLVDTLAQGLKGGHYQGLAGLHVLDLQFSSDDPNTAMRSARTLASILTKTRNRVILFVDETQSPRPLRAFLGQILSPLESAAEKGDITLIHSMAPENYGTNRGRDPLLWEKIEVKPPNAEETEAILEAHAGKLASEYGLPWERGFFKTAIRLASRYIADYALPDSALYLVKRTLASRTRRAILSRLYAECFSLIQHLAQNLERYRQLTQSPSETAAITRLYNALVQDIERLLDLRAEINTLVTGQSPIWPVSGADAARVLSEMSGVSVNKLLQEEPEKLLHLEENLRNRVLYQDPALKAVADAVRRARTGIRDPKKPAGIFMFLGPTGVGKTETARALAEFLFDDEKNMIRLDMSEYMEPHSVARLIGSPPGYIGHEAGGQLTEAVRKASYAVVLLDEIEKAHPDVLNVLLQTYEDGRLTDGQGRTVNFSNVIFIMTSNLGSAHIQDLMKENADRARIEKDATSAVRAHFRPEFINRLDQVILFDPIKKEQMGDLVDLHLKNKVRHWLKNQGLILNLPIEPETRAFLIEEGFDPLYGARPLARAVQKWLLDPLAIQVLKDKSKRKGEDGPERRVKFSFNGRSFEPEIEDIPPAPPEDRRILKQEDARELLPRLLARQEPWTSDDIYTMLFGSVEDTISRKPLGIFHPMEEPSEEVKLLDVVSAATDDPNAKDAALEQVRQAWPRSPDFPTAHLDTIFKWLEKNIRCAKTTNFKRPAGHDAVRLRWARGDGYDEFDVRALPLTRQEIFETARIFEDHFQADSHSKDESWALADKLLAEGKYGRASLFEIKRAINQIPGATFGWWADDAGVKFWLKIPHHPAEAASKRGSDASSITGQPAHRKESGAADVYRDLVKNDPKSTKPLQEIIAGLLDSDTALTVYWGFRTARATLDDASFEKLIPFMPPASALSLMPIDVQEHYREDLFFKGYYAAPNSGAAPSSADQMAYPIRNVLLVNEHSIGEARWLAAHANEISPEQKTMLFSEIFQKHRRAWRLASIFSPLWQIFTKKWTMYPLWITTIGSIFGVFIYSGITKHFPFLTVHSALYPHWILASLGYLVLSITQAILLTAVGQGDIFSDYYMSRLNRYGQATELATVLADIWPRPTQARLARALKKLLKKAHYRSVNGLSDTNRGYAGHHHRAAAEGLEKLAPLLPESKKHALAALLLRRAASVETREKPISFWDQVSPLYIYDLLDSRQQGQALDFGAGANILQEDAAWGPNLSVTLLYRLHQLAQQGKIPQDKREAILRSLLTTVQNPNRQLPPGYGLLLCDTVVLLAKDLPDAEKSAVAEGLWKARTIVWMGIEQQQDNIGNKPLEFYKSILELAPTWKWADRLLKYFSDAKFDAAIDLAWLIQTGFLDSGQLRLAETVLRKSIEKGNSDAVAALFFLKHIPWDERIQIFLDQIRSTGRIPSLTDPSKFMEALAALYREKSGRPAPETEKIPTP